MSGDRRFGDMKVTALLTETKTATSEIVAASDLGLPLPSNFTAVGTLPGTNTYTTITTPICTSHYPHGTHPLPPKQEDCYAPFYRMLLITSVLTWSGLY